jgi:hypothetical protein
MLPMLLRRALASAVVLVGLLTDCSALHVAPAHHPRLTLPVSGATHDALRGAALSPALRGGASEGTFGAKLFDAYLKTAQITTNLFPLWTVIFTGIALKSPKSFEWFDTKYFTAVLAALMLSMGITLSPAEFAAVAKEPTSIFLQFSLCYVMMPLLAFALGKAFKLNDALLAGTVLVGCINGGQVGGCHLLMLRACAARASNVGDLEFIRGVLAFTKGSLGFAFMAV